MGLRFRFACHTLLILLVALLVGVNGARANAAADARAAFERGVQASREARWEEAREHFAHSRALVVKPSTLFNLAVANLKLGRAEETLRALDEFEKLASSDQHEAMLTRAKGLRAEAERMWEAERPAGERVRTLIEPEGLSHSAQLEFERGRDAFAKGEDKQALDAFTRAHAASRRVELLYDIGVVADRLRDDRRAIDAFQRFAAASPDAREVTLAQKRIERLQQGLTEREAGQSAVAVTASEDARTPRFLAPAPPALTAPRTMIVLGAVLLATAVGSTAWYFERRAAHDACHRPDQVCENVAQIERHRRAAAALSVSLDLAAVTLITGGALWLHRRKRGGAQLTGLLEGGPGALMVGSRLRF